MKIKDKFFLKIFLYVRYFVGDRIKIIELMEGFELEFKLLYFRSEI